MNNCLSLLVAIVFATVAFGHVSAVAADADAQTFHSPTGNTGCRFTPQTRELQCDVVGGLTAPYCNGRATGYTLPSQGPGPGLACAGDTLHAGPVLAYGRTWTEAGITCTSREDGLTCLNQHGLGFFLALGEGHTIDPIGPDIAATPQQVVVSDLRHMLLMDDPADLAPVRADKTNIAGPYAVVSVRGRQFLAERFSYGWMVLGGAPGKCELERRGIGASDAARLLAGMSDLSKPCFYYHPDQGPASDVEAIRKLAAIRGGDIIPYVPYAGVEGNFGYAEQAGEIGSCEFFRRVAGAWQMIVQCKGGVPFDMLQPFGFTRTIYCDIHWYEGERSCAPRPHT